jgi:hypothetical protein
MAGESSEGEGGDGSDPAKPEIPCPSGEVLVSETEKYKLILQGNVLSLRAKDKVRLSPKTVLHTFVTGACDAHKGDAPSEGIAFKFSKPKDEIVDPTQKVVSLGHFVKVSNADRLFGHDAFAKGVAPITFVPKKDNRYTPSEHDTPIVNAARNHSLVNLVWSVACMGGKITPKGLAVVTDKLIVLKADENFLLTKS